MEEKIQVWIVNGAAWYIVLLKDSGKEISVAGLNFIDIILSSLAEEKTWDKELYDSLVMTKIDWMNRKIQGLVTRQSKGR